jgi:hypothetical protein
METQTDLQVTKDLLLWQCLSSRLSHLLKELPSGHAELAGRRIAAPDTIAKEALQKRIHNKRLCFNSSTSHHDDSTEQGR